MKYLIIVLILVSCGRRSAPQITYIDNVLTKYDTITDFSFGGVDTIYSTTPCDSFTVMVRKNDTVYIRQIKKVIETKLVTKHDTIVRQPIVVQNGKTTIKTDNSVTAKKGSIIGNDNTMTTKKGNWWWIFLAGMLTYFIIQNIGFKALKTYFPFLNFLP